MYYDICKTKGGKDVQDTGNYDMKKAPTAGKGVVE
jgi:hypothetical protein